MSKYRLMAVDMDGTLLNEHHEISCHTEETIRRAVEQGKYVVPCTGRNLAELLDYEAYFPLFRYSIQANGTTVYDHIQQRPVSRLRMDDEELRYIYEVIQRRDTMTQMFIEGKGYLDKKDSSCLPHYRISEGVSRMYERRMIWREDLWEWVLREHIPVEKIAIFYYDIDQQNEDWKLFERRDVTLTQATYDIVEISHRDSGKGAGLRRLCEVLGIPLEETIAAGDGPNDLAMLETAGFAVAMDNACDEVKSIADWIAPSCYDDGVAAAIEQLLLD